jgi:release factor family 2
MDTSSLSTLYQSSGPFATALIDVGHETETGEHEHELRVRAACEALREQGADEGVVAAVGERLGEVVHEPAPVARVVVATRDGVQYDETASFRVDDPLATWAPLPDLARWIEHRDATVAFVLAVVDHEGGDVGVYRSDLPSPEELTTVEGSVENIHQVGADDWGALKYQHRTENVWARNAAEVADRISAHVRAGTRLVLLAGDPRSKSLVHERLNDAEAMVVELDHGTRAEDGGDEALESAVRAALLDHVVRRRLERVHELRGRLGRGESVATGAADVADALVRGQVETLLLDPAAAADVELDVTQHPGLSLPDGTFRADQALVAAAVLTDAEVGVTPAPAMGGAPVAALLRWNQPPS